MSPQCVFIQMSFWDGTGLIFNDSEPPSLGTQRLRFADCGSSLCELRGAAVCKEAWALTASLEACPCQFLHL